MTTAAKRAAEIRKDELIFFQMEENERTDGVVGFLSALVGDPANLWINIKLSSGSWILSLQDNRQ